MRFLALSLLLLPLAACTSADPEMGLRSSAALLPQTVVPSLPVGVSLPTQAGAVLSSTERNGPQSRLRRTVLRSEGTLPGENFVSVETGGPAGTRPGLLRPPPIKAIQAEMRAALPGVPMRLGGTMEENASGPVGYAVGRAGGTACLYAWQWLDLGARGGFLARRDPAGIRVRLCRGKQFEPLLQAVRGMRVGDGVRGDPADGSAGGSGGDALAATGVGATAGLGGFAQSPGLPEEAEISDEAPRAVRRKIRRAVAVPRIAAAPQPASPEGGPAIPLPGPEAASDMANGAADRTRSPWVPRQPPVAEPEDDTPLIPDPTVTAATR